MNADIYKSLTPEQKLFAELLNDILTEQRLTNEFLQTIVAIDSERT